MAKREFEGQVSFGNFPGLAGDKPAILNRQFFADDARAKGVPDEPRKVDGNILNVRPDPIDFRDNIYEASLVELESWAYPGQMGSRGLEVRDQGNEGSCTGQALAAVIDLQNIVRHDQGVNVPARVSARMLYQSARGYDEYPDDDLPGSSSRGAIKGFYHRGVCSAAGAPYFPGDIGWQLTVEHAKDARRVTLGAYLRLRHILNDYHAAITEAQAIFCSAMIHPGWERDKVAANKGRIEFPQKNGAKPKPTGAHAFAIVGYDPLGFIVLNSWGEEWGGLDCRDAVQRVLSTRGAADGSTVKTPTHLPQCLPGMAHWRYDDWSEHVLDAWVLRLQVPTGRPAGFSGGYYRERVMVSATEPKGDRALVAGSEIIGHYIHVDDGAFVGKMPYDNTSDTFEETAALLIKNEELGETERYNHLLFYAHGGLNDLRDGVARATATIDGFKRNGIYPVFYLWRTGLQNVTADILRRLFEQALGRAGNFTDMTDRLLEKKLRPLGKPIWSEMKLDARLSFADSGSDGIGSAWTATRSLLKAATARKNQPLRVHFIGHSAGAILLGQLFARARAEKLELAGMTDTVSLFAPAASWDFFAENLSPLARQLAKENFAVYNLTDEAERADTVAEFYRKSLLYLVSQALESDISLPISGMDIFWRDHRKPKTIAYYLAGKKSQGVVPSQSTSHGGFDNDPVTMNHVLNRILGLAPGDNNPNGFAASELSADLF
jgi:hypothetical protein